MNTTLLDRPVGQLVAERPSRSRVFERWGIDYCCSGKKALGEACAARELDPEAVLRELEQIDAIPHPTGTDWTKESLGVLCDHIEQVHHGYLREALPRLTMLTDRVAERHGTKDPRLVALANVVRGFRFELESHMMKEESILFPAIRTLEVSGGVSGLEGPITVMLSEHDNAGADLATMRRLTDDFQPGPAACNTHRAMLDALAEMEADMHQHVHKENNILFPRAIERQSPSN